MQSFAKEAKIKEQTSRQFKGYFCFNNICWYFFVLRNYFSHVQIGDGSHENPQWVNCFRHSTTERGEYCSTYFHVTEQMEDASEDVSGEDFIIPHTSLRGFSFPFMLANIPVQYVIFLAVPDVIFQTAPDALGILTYSFFFFSSPSGIICCSVAML